MITLDLSVLNQKGTPMFFSDLTANRPAAGIVGRIFIAIDSPYGIFRDTGTGWDQVSGAGSFSGSLATGQVAYGTATNTIGGSSGLTYSDSNGRITLSKNQNNNTQIIASNTTSGALSVAEIVFQSNTIGSAGKVSSAYAPYRTIAASDLYIYNGGSGDITILNDFASGKLKFASGASSTAQMTLTASGRLLLGTTTENTFIADVNGTARVSGYTLFGSGNTGTPLATLADFRGGSDVDFIQVARVSTSSDRYVRIYANGYIDALSTKTDAPAYTFAGAANSNTAGTRGLFSLTNTFNPTSGTATYTTFQINQTINQTGGANGISRGLLINPTLTAASDWRSIQWDNNTGWGLYGAGTALNYLGGSLGIKTTSPYAPSTFSLDVNGGLLVKNTAGTTAQITLINADPSIGGNNGFLVASVGGTSGGSYVDFQGYYGTSIVGSTALRLNSAGGAVIVNSTTNSGEQFQLTGTLRINGQASGTAGGSSGQHLIINLDGTTYKIALLNP